MNEEQYFLEAINAGEPNADLIYADWLEEQGRPEADEIREPTIVILYRWSRSWYCSWSRSKSCSSSSSRCQAWYCSWSRSNSSSRCQAWSLFGSSCHARSLFRFRSQSCSWSSQTRVIA